MTCRTILEYPDPALAKTAAAVTTFDGRLGQIIDDLTETLQATPGLGLAAPQIGEPLAAFALLSETDGAAPDVYVNPEILQRSGFCVVEERCLSVPGAKANMVRAAAVKIRAHDRDGELFERQLTGMSAACFQHELDHLHGKIFVDRLSSLRRWFTMRRRKPEADHALA